MRSPAESLPRFVTSLCGPQKDHTTSGFVLQRWGVGLAQQLLRQAADVYRADHYEKLRLRAGG